MNKLKLGHTRVKEIIEPNIIYTTYRGLVMDYYMELFSDYKNTEYEWFYQYYKESHENLINMCNEFLNNEYELIIPFVNACKLYNSYSKEFDKLLKVDTDLTKDLVDLRINYIHIKLDKIKKTIFKIKKENEEKINRDFKLLDNFSDSLTDDDAKELNRYINICKKRNGNKMKES